MHIRLLFLTAWLPVAVLLASCRTSEPFSSNEIPGEKPRYSITYVIHGDAGYLYHDSTGTARQADEKVLREAMRVGEQAGHGEVLIFHQKPEKKVLWLFPKKDRRFLYYRNGELIRETNYSPGPGEGVFAAESRLLRRHRSSPDTARSIFLYFGHEIPYTDGAGYFKSLPGLAFNTDTFTGGLRDMLPGSGSFGLTVLSTCNNGSPDMVHALQPYTNVLLASPQNLHLSHIDTEGLASLERNPSISSKELAEMLAQRTYNRLVRFLQTVISLSVYDMETIGPAAGRIDAVYRNYLHSHNAAEPGVDNIDCAGLPVFDGTTPFSEGVESWYRAPRFGRKAGEASHSGWGCKE